MYTFLMSHFGSMGPTVKLNLQRSGNRQPGIFPGAKFLSSSVNWRESQISLEPPRYEKRTTRKFFS